MGMVSRYYKNPINSSPLTTPLSLSSSIPCVVHVPTKRNKSATLATLDGNVNHVAQHPTPLQANGMVSTVAGMQSTGFSAPPQGVESVFGTTPATPGGAVRFVAAPTTSTPVAQFGGQTVPGQPIPGQTIPGQTIPGQTIPGQTIPGQTTRWVNYAAF